MLEPKKIKYRKVQRRRGQWRGKAWRGSRLAFGNIGLKTTVTGEITARQIEAARRAMTRSVARGGKIWIRVFPHNPVTKKAAEVPMGCVPTLRSVGGLRSSQSHTHSLGIAVGYLESQNTGIGDLRCHLGVSNYGWLAIC